VQVTGFGFAGRIFIALVVAYGFGLDAGDQIDRRRAAFFRRQVVAGAAQEDACLLYTSDAADDM
jgi:hypothetical protein